MAIALFRGFPLSCQGHFIPGIKPFFFTNMEIKGSE